MALVQMMEQMQAFEHFFRLFGWGRRWGQRVVRQDIMFRCGELECDIQPGPIRNVEQMVGYRISMGLCGEGKGNPFEQFVSCVVHVLPPQPRKKFGETYFNQTFSSHICKMTFQHSITMESFRRTHVFAVPRRFFR